MKKASMKTPRTLIINLLLIPSLIAVLNLIPACRVTAQTFTTLHSFYFSDGAYPFAGLIANSSGNTLYGTASKGSANGGTVFALNTDGTAFTILYSFQITSLLIT